VSVRCIGRHGLRVLKFRSRLSQRMVNGIDGRRCFTSNVAHPGKFVRCKQANREGGRQKVCSLPRADWPNRPLTQSMMRRNPVNPEKQRALAGQSSTNGHLVV
jgi:hypothetical protein